MGRLLWAVGALVLAMLAGTVWASRETAKREALVYTSLAAQAYKEDQFERGMRYALQGYSAIGEWPWSPHSTALEGKLAGGPMMTRLQQTLRGHDKPVYEAAISPDGKRVVTASFDNTARLWDAETGKEIAVLKAHEGGVTAASFSPDGKRVVTASDDATARLWDAETGKEIAVLKAHVGEANGARFSPDGRRIVSAGNDNVARIWDVAWVLVYGDTLRERVCRDFLAAKHEERFTIPELDDPILSSIAPDDETARNPCLRLGPLSWEYYTQRLARIARWARTTLHWPRRNASPSPRDSPSP